MERCVFTNEPIVPTGGGESQELPVLRIESKGFMNRCISRAGVPLMLRWLCLLLAFLYLPVNALCDRVVLKNGDTLTGTVVAWKDGNFEIKTALIGDVKAPWNSVASIQTDHPLFIVLANQSIQCTSLSLSENAVQVTGPNCGNRIFAKSEVRFIRSESAQMEEEELEQASIVELWNASFDAGLSAARSDASSTNVNLGMNAVHVTASDRITINATSLYSQTTTADNQRIATTAVRAGARYARNLGNRSFAFGFGTFETDELQLLDLRRDLGAGLGYKLVSSPNLRFDAFSGGSFLQESFSGQPRRTAGELLFGQELAFKPRKTEFTESLTFFPNLTDRGEYRITLDSSAAVSLNSWLGWHTTLSEIYITNPPVGTPGNTFLLTTGLRVKFGKDRTFQPNAKIEGL